MCLKIKIKTENRKKSECKIKIEIIKHPVTETRIFNFGVMTCRNTGIIECKDK